MKKFAVVSFVLSALLLSAVLPDEAWGRGGSRGHFSGRGRVVIVGSSYWWGWGPYPYWWYPPPYYYAYPTPVIVQEPPVYIQQSAPPVAPTPELYWYYCQSAREYYPMVQTCPEPWVKVAPRP